MNPHATSRLEPAIESPYAWLRLALGLAVVSIGNVGMYAASIVLPLIQADFGVDRGSASLPYAVTMVGFGVGGVLMGRMTDRHGLFGPLVVGGLALGLGFFIAGTAGNILVFDFAHGLLIGFLGNAAMFAPVVSDISHWFTRHRGMAVAICLSGNFVAGALWPPVMRYFVAYVGWRSTYIGIGAFCVITLLPLAWCLRRRPPAEPAPSAEVPTRAPARPRVAAVSAERPLGLAPNTLLILLSIAGVGCCVAMAMPQVQIVAYCIDMGYGFANGTQMLSVMLGMGIISRLGSGWLSDRVGGLNTLLLGSVLQAIALVFYLFSHGLMSLYVVSALFGLFQGGIVPAYAVIVREYFPPRNAGTQIGVVLMATMVGMALGGWMSGAIHDLSGSYEIAFLNGIAWNALNAAIVAFLLYRSGSWRRVQRLAF